MKLNEVKPYLEMSGEMEEQFFSIQDTGMIFDILRNKMYSNPILAIAREISCNARDAHREVGKANVPIEIALPNSLQPEYRVRDFGPGISPDRMSNIFIKYTASTKRSDNIQTGGFGLGAKTPFSYSDSFSIITNFDGKKYVYNCLIDSTKVGKLMLASECPTKDPNGTEIIIPVLSKNFNDFNIWTEQACRHWDVKPIITGSTINWQTPRKIIEGDKWAIVNADYQRNAKMIIDGIEYPLDIEVLRKYADGSIIDAARGNFLMYFGVGELSLSASREQIYLDEKTQKIIKARLATIQNEVKQKIVDKINSCSNLWEANIYFRKELKDGFNNINFLGPLTWNGIILTEQYVYVDCPVYTFSRGKYSRKYGTDPNKLSRQKVNHICFDEFSDLYINDLQIGDPTPRHVKKAFDDDPNLKTLNVICPADKKAIDNLNTKVHLDKMNAKMISSITKSSGRKYTAPSARLIVFKYDSSAPGFRQVSYASIEEDAKQKVLCRLVKQNYTYNQNERVIALKNKKSLTDNQIRSLLIKFPEYSFYGIDTSISDDRVQEDFSDLLDIEKFLKEKIVDNKINNYIEIKCLNAIKPNLDNQLLRIHDKILKKIKDNDSLYIKRMNLHLKIKNMISKDLDFLQIYELLNGEISDSEIKSFTKKHPEYDVESIDNKFLKKYPMLFHINYYSYDNICDDIASYVNLADKE